MSVDPIFETDFVKEMARQMRALDTLSLIHIYCRRVLAYRATLR